MSDAVSDQIRIDLDRNASEAQRRLAQEIFGVDKIGIRGRYAIDAEKIIEITQNLLLGAGGSAVWSGIQWVAPRVREYISNKLFPDNTTAVAIYRAASAGLTWEIRFRSDQSLGEYEAGIVINCVDTSELPDDAARISINLIEKRIAAFDSAGLHIKDLSWPKNQ